MRDLIPYELTFEVRESYLYARIDAGRISETTSAEYLAEIKAECDAAGLRRLMIDRRIPHVTETMAKFNIAKEASSLLLRIKTAWVNPYPENREMLEFATLVAQNRGARFGLFTNEGDAEQWLLLDSDPARRPDQDRSRTADTAWLGD